MISRRVPDETANPWSAALAVRRRSGVPLLDLTDADPWRAGLSRAGDAREAAGGSEDVEDGAPPSADPRGWLPAREAVASYYGERGIALDPAHVILTTGASESYAHLFRLLADPGAAIAAPRPSYPLFEPLARAEGVALATYRLEPANGWRLDLDSLDAALADGARAVLVVQPNHPTGSCLDDSEVAALERRCRACDAAIISDEVFGDYGWTPGRRALPSLLGARAVPTFVLSGLSKVCGRPDLKLGWIAACGPAAERDRALGGLEWLADLFLSVSAPAQRAAPACLAGRRAFQRRVHARLDASLAALRDATRTHPEITWRETAGGWVAVLRVPERDGEEALALRLLERDVVVHPGHFYDFEAGAHVVVSLLAGPRALAAGLARLREVLAERG